MVKMSMLIEEDTVMEANAAIGGGNNDGMSEKEGQIVTLKSVSDNSDNDNDDVLKLVSAEESESMIAQELMHLSIQERDEVLHDLHGVANITEETPDFVESCLCNLEAELTSITTSEKRGFYDYALRTNPSYVRDRRFRTMFLRSVKFDAPSAANLMVNYFEQKARLFGRTSLTKNVGMNELDEEAMQCLKSGYIQLVPGKDRSGRSVLIALAKLRSFQSEKAFVRAFWYMATAALEDEEAQKKGLVMVSYALDNTVQRKSGALQFASVIRALPMRVVGVHVCVNDPAVQAFAKVLSLFFEAQFRLRIRAHCGTDLECQYSMMTFGLPIKQMPVSLSGDVDKKAHDRWIQERARKAAIAGEEQTILLSEPDFIIDDHDDIGMPGPFDVLFGRGKFVQEHSGNQIFRQMIEEYRGRYDMAMKVEKTQIAKEIVQTIHDSGGHFLKQSNDTWIEVSVDVARDKVSHSFRNRRVSSSSTTGGVGGLNRRITSNNSLASNSMGGSSMSGGSFSGSRNNRWGG